MVKNKQINKTIYVLKKRNHTAEQDFPGGPVVKNQSFKAEDASSIPAQGN